ncbi:hypothetical protein OSB04_013471 [Centaurea solstitialis]|uniref:Uncharacterized protein n=1 Tax=Centaurea solstitialis TaxID=347529 RepID=A0AA38WFI9_9ASTR|nr:hypothetical protein OSB04_013471 [Centaurea solstitialis]
MHGIIKSDSDKNHFGAGSVRSWSDLSIDLCITTWSSEVVTCIMGLFVQAGKILANLIVMGSGILARAFVQAYRQAIQNASKSGVAQETLQNAVRKGSKVMTEQEARQILGVTEQSSWEEIAKASTRHLN